ncbi:MAG: DUF2380 domain-containing protein [Candidatus Methylomirabilaceae bacterium]
MAKQLNAEQVLVPWVFRMSNLVLTMHVEIRDVATGRILGPWWIGTCPECRGMVIGSFPPGFVRPKIASAIAVPWCGPP